MWVQATVVAVVVASSPAAADEMSPEDLARKPERGHVTGVPLAAYSVDFGYGGGARAYYYWNGHRTDARFAETPYLHRVFAQVFATTRGAQYHWLDYDAPRIAGTDYRIRAQAALGRNTEANYYGYGGVQRTLRFPGSPDAFDKLDDYTAAQRRSAGGIAYTKYDQVDIAKPMVQASIERSFWGRRVRVLAGFGLSYARVRDYTGASVAAVDEAGAMTTATMAATRLREDCDAGKLVGCAGGRDNFVRVGASYDTRDFEPDPNRGIFADVELDAGTVLLGSEYTYARGLAAVRGWWSPIPELADLVLAGRALIDIQSEGTPFFTMSQMPFTEDPHFGLGGHRTMRGFRQDRFVDHVMSAANVELRWTFARTTIKHQKLAFIATPFLDLGRTFPSVSDLTLRGWFPSYGGAFRVSWNLSTLVTFDYGICRESTGFYVNFGHTF